GNLKGVGRIYQQTFIDTYTKVSFAKLYDRKTPITAADLLNDRVLPFFEEHDVKLLRVLTDRGSEFCGNPERHEYELYLAVEDIDHSRTKTKSPQTNGICERFHRTALNEFYRVAFRKKVYRSIDELQADLDAWIREYNEARPHSMVDVALATSAAPTIYRPLESGGYRLIDGGVWANNPTVLAVVEAMIAYDVPRDRVKVLSIGCGDEPYHVTRRMTWGGLWHWRKII